VKQKVAFTADQPLTTGVFLISHDYFLTDITTRGQSGERDPFKDKISCDLNYRE
jgi:hypothetical protein